MKAYRGQHSTAAVQPVCRQAACLTIPANQRQRG
jgi:hypothetical protein